jgi:hypothetical protein
MRFCGSENVLTSGPCAEGRRVGRVVDLKLMGPWGWDDN